MNLFIILINIIMDWLEPTHFTAFKNYKKEDIFVELISILETCEKEIGVKIYIKFAKKKIICECHIDSVRYLKFEVNIYNIFGGENIIELHKRTKGRGFGFDRLYKYIWGKVKEIEEGGDIKEKLEEKKAIPLPDSLEFLDPPSPEDYLLSWQTFIDATTSKNNGRGELNDIFETWTLEANNYNYTKLLTGELIHKTFDCILDILSNFGEDKQTIFSSLSLLEIMMKRYPLFPELSEGDICALTKYLLIWSKSGKQWLTDKCENVYNLVMMNEKKEERK